MLLILTAEEELGHSGRGAGQCTKLGVFLCRVEWRSIWQGCGGGKGWGVSYPQRKYGGAHQVWGRYKNNEVNPKLICMAGEGDGTPLQYSCLENPMDGGAWWAAVRGVTKSRTRLSDFTFTFHFHALEKEMATHSSVLAWRIPGTGETGGPPSMGSHRVGHDWSDLAAAAAAICIANSQCKARLLPQGTAVLKQSGFKSFPSPTTV